MPMRPPSPQVLITWAWGHIPSCSVKISGLERLLYLTQGRGERYPAWTPAISPATGTMCLDPMLGCPSGKPRWACPLLGETHHWEMCNHYDWPCKLRLHLRPALPRQTGQRENNHSFPKYANGILFLRLTSPGYGFSSPMSVEMSGLDACYISQNSFSSGTHCLDMGFHHPCPWRCPAWTPATSHGTLSLPAHFA